MRGQEIFAPEKSDLLPDKGMLHIHQALEEVEKKHNNDRRFILGDTKNEESERYAPAVQEVFACFKELEQIQVENGWRDNAYKKGNGSLAIIDRNGEIVDKRAFNRNLGLYLENVEFSLGHTVDGVRGEYLADLTPDYVKLLLPKITEMAEQVRKEEQAV